MVDNVLANDPRIKRIKAEEKAAREAKKKGGAGGAKVPTPAEKKAAEDAKKAEEEKAKKAAAGPELSKAEKEAQKKAKEAARKNLKKWKKVSFACTFPVSSFTLDIHTPFVYHLMTPWVRSMVPIPFGCSSSQLPSTSSSLSFVPIIALI